MKKIKNGIGKGQVRSDKLIGEFVSCNVSLNRRKGGEGERRI
ncbi:hypothetical protein [Clostridium algidicarnis]|nr:hypothetical protein [Clostridium algidicarnis]